MHVIRKTIREVGTLKSNGSCVSCGVDHEYPEEGIVVIKFFEDEGRTIFVPVDTLECPSCGKSIDRIIVYKSLDITEELASLKGK